MIAGRKIWLSLGGGAKEYVNGGANLKELVRDMQQAATRQIIDWGLIGHAGFEGEGRRRLAYGW